MRIKSITIITLLLLISIFIISLHIGTYTNKQTTTHQDQTNPSQEQTIQVLEFSLSNYWSKVFDFHYEKNVGSVTTPEVAIEKAKEVWRERYGKLYEESTYPIVVAYDAENECWLVNETLEDKHLGEYVVGATPHVLIKAGGRVLAVWYG